MRKYNFDVKFDSNIDQFKMKKVLEGCLISIYFANNNLILQIYEYFYKKIEVRVMQTNRNTMFLLCRNEHCILIVRGYINKVLWGKYYKYRFIFSDGFFKLKEHLLSKEKEYDDFDIYKTNISVKGYFRKINSNISLECKKSLLFIRSID